MLKEVTMNPGETKGLYCLLSSGKAITLSADDAAAGLLLQDAAFSIEAPQESYAPPAKPEGTAAAKFDSWLKDLVCPAGILCIRGCKILWASGKFFQRNRSTDSLQ